METDDILKINGEALPSPLPFKVGVSDQDLNSTMDAKATMHRNRIAVKRKISLEWGPLDWASISKILKAIKGVYFECTYPDPETRKI